MSTRGLALVALGGLQLVATGALAADPASVPAPVLRTGDSWVYQSTIERGTNGFAEGDYVAQIDDVRDDGILLGIKRQGSPQAPVDQERGPDWSERRIVDGQPTTTERPYDFPLSIGKSWTMDYEDPTHYGLQTSAHVHKVLKVTGWEDVTTPAGTFHALKIEGHGTLKGQIAASSGGVGGVTRSEGDATAVVHTQTTPAHVEYATTYMSLDYVPALKSFVKSVHETYNASGVRTRREIRVLQSYKLAG